MNKQPVGDSFDPNRTSEFGRAYAVFAGVAAVGIAGASLFVWFKDAGKQAACGSGGTEVFNFVLIGKWASSVLVLVSGSVVIACVRAGPHRMAASFGTVLALGGIPLLLFAFEVHHGNVSSCLN